MVSIIGKARREKEPELRHQSLSEELRDFKLEALEPPAAADTRSLLGAIAKKDTGIQIKTLCEHGALDSLQCCQHDEPRTGNLA